MNDTPAPRFTAEQFKSASIAIRMATPDQKFAMNTLADMFAQAAADLAAAPTITTCPGPTNNDIPPPAMSIT